MMTEAQYFSEVRAFPTACPIEEARPLLALLRRLTQCLSSGTEAELSLAGTYEHGAERCCRHCQGLSC